MYVSLQKEANLTINCNIYMKQVKLIPTDLASKILYESLSGDDFKEFMLAYLRFDGYFGSINEYRFKNPTMKSLFTYFLWNNLDVVRKYDVVDSEQENINITVLDDTPTIEHRKPVTDYYKIQYRKKLEEYRREHLENPTKAEKIFKDYCDSNNCDYEAQKIIMVNDTKGK